MSSINKRLIMHVRTASDKCEHGRGVRTASDGPGRACQCRVTATALISLISRSQARTVINFANV